MLLPPFFIILSLISNSLCIFGPDDKIYNEIEALKLFEIIASAHSETPEKCFERRLKDENVKLIGREDMVCDMLGSRCTFVIAEIREKNQIIVGIRGTQSMSQFFYEFVALFTPHQRYIGDGWVNHYYATAHSKIWNRVLSYLKHGNFSNHDVIFTGHSLGGSLSTLSAMRSVLEGVRNSSQVKLVTFAEPRPGNFKFAKNIDNTVEYKFRILNRGDLLAKFPPCYKNFRLMPYGNLGCEHGIQDGPYHHMTEVWYPEGMKTTGSKYVVCDGLQGEDPSCSNSLHIELKNFGQSITDHRQYFGVMVSQYGESGCDRDQVFDESEGLLGNIKSIAELIQKIWIF